MKKISVIPNRGARFGHQFTEWLAGYVFCMKNNILFYHHNFVGNSCDMDKILNLSFGEMMFNDYKENIINSENLPLNEYLSSKSDDLYLYNFFDSKELSSFVGKYNDEIRNKLKIKYYSNKEKVSTDTISLHIRRDDVKSSNIWSDRYININYFTNILNDLYKDYPDYNVRIFSSNVDDGFYEIKDRIFYKNIHFHVNDNLSDSIYYMISSKILVTSNSGISYIASLISDEKNIKICPDKFWLKWPDESIIKNY